MGGIDTAPSGNVADALLGAEVVAVSDGLENAQKTPSMRRSGIGVANADSTYCFGTAAGSSVSNHGARFPANHIGMEAWCRSGQAGRLPGT